MTRRYHSTRPDTWTAPRQSRHADFGHGRIEPMHPKDGRAWFWIAPASVLIVALLIVLIARVLL